MAKPEGQKTFPSRPDSLQKDCYSKAFALAGLIDEERPLEKSEIKELLKGCSPIKRPKVGSLVHLFNGEKEHIAVVSSLNPTTVSDRAGLGGETREDLSLLDVMLEYGGLDIAVNYLQP